MSGLEQMREYLKDVKEGKTAIPPEQTHMMELMTLMRAGLDELAVVDSIHYLADALTGIVKFADGKYYRITISEEKEIK